MTNMRNQISMVSWIEYVIKRGQLRTKDAPPRNWGATLDNQFSLEVHKEMGSSRNVNYFHAIFKHVDTSLIWLWWSQDVPTQVDVGDEYRVSLDDGPTNITKPKKTKLI